MHEMAICSGIVESVREELATHDGRPLKVQVAVGGMHAIVDEFLQQAWRALTLDSDLEDTELALRFIPVRARCRECDWEGEIELPFFVCGRCGVPSVEVTAGRELYLEKLTMGKEVPT